ncbi:MAG: molybdopterin-synthase adenylyltransferase MoeB [Algibacter sp.]|uniref:molybdopterin-synthase adenylyltransferase MoeB n=1 Tax=Algibacter sp. TaxID=1872428 RepID=UPI0032997251
MLSKEEQIQYSRHILLNELGLEGQLRLKQAKVLVIGAGGLGCPILQYLTAAGVGTLGIIDDDVVDQTNLQRQVLYTVDDVGKAKVEIAAKRLSKLNPFVQFQVFKDKLTIKNALSLFKAFDIIVDGSDNFQTRYLCNDAAVITNKPLVYGSIFKFEGQVSVFNFNGSGTYRCLYPTPPKPKESPNCSDVGVMGVLPGIIGSLQANEVIKIICGLGDVLANKLVVFDVLSMRQLILSFSKTDESKILKLEEDYNFFCGIDSADQIISIDELLKNKSDFNLLDVRETWEREQGHIGGLHIPLNQLQDRYHEISTNKPLVVYCKSGIRSKKAILFLRDVFANTTLINLRNGLPIKFLIKY